MSEAPASRTGSLRRNSIANIAGRTASALVWVLVTPFALSHLGQERFAVWSLFFALGGGVASLDLGMANGVSRYVALATARNDRRNLVVVLRRSLTLSACIGLVWCLLCIACRGPLMGVFHVPLTLQPEVARSLVVFAASMFVFSVTQVLNGALMGFQRLDLSNLCFLSGLVLQTLVLVVGLAAGAGLVAATAAALCGNALSGTLASRLVRRQLRAMPGREATEHVTWRELLGFGGAVQATAACAVGQQLVNKPLLGMLGQLVWVTQFELGFRVANAIWSVPTLMQGAVIPAAAHASAGGGLEPVRAVYDWACRWIFALAGFVLAGLWLVAPALITLWLGPGHADSIGVTRTLAVAFIIATVSGPATAVARGGGWPLLETWNFAAALGLNVLLSLWLVPRYGPAGAAIAMASSYGLAGAWLIVTLHRVLEVHTGPWLVRLALPRFVLPCAAAVLLWRLWPAAMPAGKLEALRQLALQGAAFTVLAAALSWPTGDPASLLARLRRGGPRPVPGPVQEVPR